jgi:hypothetical protein
MSRLPFAERYPTATHPCPFCHKTRPASGHDPCFANLPAVKAACCGHGGGDGYITFTDGRILTGRFESMSKPTKGDRSERA